MCIRDRQSTWEECKDLELIRDYLISIFMQKEDRNKELTEQIEDIKTNLDTEIELKKHFIEKMGKVESTLHELNAKITKDNEIMAKLNIRNTELETDMDRLRRERTEVDSKLKVLAKEVKTLRTRNVQLEETLESLYTNCNELREVFSNINIEDA
eukprot:TRINITY_DN10573_c0_g1_i5.p1 TRINITY_DN10573_c0_g1~~TRINITY_DN10573_c0_g1_i5.p1  ORF type:complete len:155 (+),score=51.84 TRINITY_DN10573_c0_g1_i5:104-568(+)